jgi:hypothetical protein
MTGDVCVLNTRQGDLQLTFNSDDPREVARAQRAVEDMLRRGYILFIEVDGKLERVTAFDSATNEYLISEGPLYSGDVHVSSKSGQTEAAQEPSAEEITEPKPQRKRGRPRKVPAGSTRATAVAPTAGG